MGFLSDLVHGKEKKYKADPLAGDINDAGKAGLTQLRAGGEKLSSIYNQDPSQVIDSQIGIENKLMRSSADDLNRRTNQLLAQRGLSGSSIGLGQQVNQQKLLSDKLALNKASGFQRLRDMSIENGQGLLNTGNALAAPKLASGVQMTDLKTRTGGYASLIAGGLSAAGQYYANKEKTPKESPAVAMNYQKGGYENYA